MTEIMRGFKSLVCMSVLTMFVFTLTGCGGLKSTSGVTVKKWDNFYEGNNIHFYYENSEDVNMVQLRNKYKIDDVVKDGKDDFEKAVLLMNWVNGKLKFNKGSVTTKDDAAGIIKDSENGSAVSDKDYAIVFTQAAASVGIVARRGEFKVKDSLHEIKDFSYNVCEVWSDKENKWIMFDVVNKCYAVSNGKPLSAVEILQRSFNGTSLYGVKDSTQYIKKMEKYLFSYTINVDSSTLGTKKSYASITYLKSGNMPEIQTSKGFVGPTIFVNKDNVFRISPRIVYSDDGSDKISTLIISKKDKNSKEDIVSFYGSAFKNSVNIGECYISINGSAWKKSPKYFDVDLSKGLNNIRLSTDGKEVCREIVLEYKK